MKSRMRHLSAIVVAVLGLAAGCSGSANHLEGSISDAYSLEFDDVNVSKVACTLRIDYIKRWNAWNYIQCRVAIDTSDVTLTSGSHISGATFLEAVRVSRINPTGRDFPEVVEGEIELDPYSFETGDDLGGSFSVGFEEGAGNLEGRFEGTLRDAKPSQTCDL